MFAPYPHNLMLSGPVGPSATGESLPPGDTKTVPLNWETATWPPWAPRALESTLREGGSLLAGAADPTAKGNLDGCSTLEMRMRFCGTGGPWGISAPPGPGLKVSGKLQHPDEAGLLMAQTLQERRFASPAR